MFAYLPKFIICSSETCTCVLLTQYFLNVYRGTQTTIITVMLLCCSCLLFRSTRMSAVRYQLQVVLFISFTHTGCAVCDQLPGDWSTLQQVMYEHVVFFVFLILWCESMCSVGFLERVENLCEEDCLLNVHDSCLCFSYPDPT